MTKPHLVAVVDDDEAIREAMRDLLESAGISSVAFESSEAFLRDPSRSDVACIVLDIHLPGMNGLELHRHLLACGDPTPVIFLTSMDDPQTRERALKSGAGGFLAKPVDSSQLLGCIQRVAGDCSR